MHHEQDMRRMGGLRKYLPITYWTCLVGSLALIGFPGTSGFFSKDALIDVVRESHIPGAAYAYYCVLFGVFITALYTFRMFFMTFHGKERMDHHTQEHLHESPWVVTLPLILLAIPSALIGWFTVQPMLFGSFFDGSIVVLPAHDALHHVAEEFHGSADFVWRALQSLPLWLAAAGVFFAWLFFLKKPELAAQTQRALNPIYKILVNKYGFDWFNEHILAAAARGIGMVFWKAGDETLIDGALVNGSARGVGWLASVMRYAQSGYLYHYAFAMILGLASLLLWLLWRGGSV
jgi:NADH-quinone oxidoreductase subunit L